MKKTNKTNKLHFSPYTVCASIACIVLSVFVLSGYISLNELTLESNRNARELEALESQNEVLMFQIEQKNSLGNIEQVATEKLGMVKLESYQVHTVNLAGDDSVEVITEEKGNDFLDGVVASFNILLEYLN